MYILQYNDQGQLETIIANPKEEVGVKVNSLPIPLDDLIEQDLVEQIETNKYKIKGVN